MKPWHFYPGVVVPQSFMHCIIMILMHPIQAACCMHAGQPETPEQSRGMSFLQKHHQEHIITLYVYATWQFEHALYVNMS